MIANLGYGALVITLLVCLFGTGAAIYGEVKKQPRWVDSARNAMLLTFPLLTVASIAIITLLVTNAFEVDYVQSVTSRSMPTYLRVTALWGGQPGSLVFWSWLMALFASAATLRDWRRDREFLPWVVVVSLVTLAFFLVLIIGFENPFVRYWATPSGSVVTAMFQPNGTTLYTPFDGRGLNPLLRHPGMIIHPPMLYLGFVSLVIPFAFGIAALITGRTDDRWIRLTRRWTLWAWLFLSLGLILGGRWAYDVLGWGGYWGWDPVEVAALLPWLTATPFLHSAMIQEKRNMFKHWNMLLIILTYVLMIMGTFLTRSGVLSSVHAFAQSAIGPIFFAYIVLTLIVSLALLSWRWDGLKSEGTLTSWLSREALFLINNVLFIAILIVCLWGLFYPILTEALGVVGQWFPTLAHIFTGQKATVGPIFYERATGPLWAALLLLMGVAPLSAWRASTARTLGKAIWLPTAVSLVGIAAVLVLSDVRGLTALLALWLCMFVTAVTLFDFYRSAVARSRAHGTNFLVSLWQLAGRNRRRYGGYVIHLGVVLMAVGIIGIEIFQTETQASLKLGETLSLGRYSIRYDSLAEFDTDDNRNVARAVVTVFKDGEQLGELYPRRDFFYESGQPMTIPGVRSSVEDDFYVLLVNWQPISTQTATFKIYLNPLVNWLWFGAAIFILGTFVAAWPEREPAPVRESRRAAAAEAIA
ncbi:MAG: heme lyase CcmF/NrfE family subunit [Anaerolineae bacterium]|nr:MAG: heme lyase CcmF/NrfE family subunit [Anaerolineae bacterium]